MRSRAQFRWFIATLLIMTYSTFIIFLLLPTAPPWLVHHWGYLPGINDPFNQAAAGTSAASSSHFGALTVWTQASPNPVAAFPSLHAAYPWLLLLFAVRIFGRKGLVMLIHNVLLWFSVVYLAQHWVIDVLAGIAWATVSFFLVEFLIRRLPPDIIGDYRPVARGQTRAGARPASLSAAPSSTLAPASISSGVLNSCSQWLSPPRLRTKIMPAGQTSARYLASCPAPDQSRVHRQARARSSSLRSRRPRLGRTGSARSSRSARPSPVTPVVAPTSATNRPAAAT